MYLRFHLEAKIKKLILINFATKLKELVMGYKTPTCPIASSCGGCEWLSVPYPIQLRRKHAAICELFDGLVPAQAIDVVEAASTTGFRHKAATPMAPGKGHRIYRGFYARGTHRIVRCTSCLVEQADLRPTLEAVADVAERMGISAYQEDRGRGLLRHAVARAGWKTDDLLLTLVCNGDTLPREREVARAIQKAAPRVSSIALNVNKRKTNAILGNRTRTLLGEGIMRDELLGCTFVIGPTSFYQTNPEQAEALYRLAIEGAQLEEGQTLVDAYCGTGTIGICAAKATHNTRVLGVESVAGAVRDAQTNASANSLADRCEFVCADATKYLLDMAREGARVDALIMDPPRAGSTPAFLKSVCALAPHRVSYVSCNPSTQRRDLDVLLAGGYKIESLTMVDMFPHTKHMESVAVLVR